MRLLTTALPVDIYQLGITAELDEPLRVSFTDDAPLIR